MDPHVVFDCQKIVSDRFALTLAAAARARALTRGAEPRINLPYVRVSDLALHEIAEGAFSQGELAPFLSGSASPARLLALNSNRPSFTATARQALPPRPSPLRRSGSLMMQPTDKENKRC